MHMLGSCMERIRVCVYPPGGVVGLLSEGGSRVSLPLFSLCLSVLQLLGVSVLQYSESRCQINSAPRGLTTD